MKQMRGFRAWHTKLNRYLEDDEFFIDTDGKVRTDSFRASNYEEAFDTNDFDSGYIIREDATGLKDKNDKEIYEGDIVKGGRLYGKDEHIVKYEDYGFYPFIVTDFDGDPMIRNVDIEVIGNIHENADFTEEEILKINTKYSEEQERIHQEDLEDAPYRREIVK